MAAAQLQEWGHVAAPVGGEISLHRPASRTMALGGLGPQWAVYDADVLPAFKDKPVKERFALRPWGMYYIDVAAKA